MMPVTPVLLGMLGMPPADQAVELSTDSETEEEAHRRRSGGRGVPVSAASPPSPEMVPIPCTLILPVPVLVPERALDHDTWWAYEDTRPYRHWSDPQYSDSYSDIGTDSDGYWDQYWEYTSTTAWEEGLSAKSVRWPLPSAQVATGPGTQPIDQGALAPTVPVSAKCPTNDEVRQAWWRPEMAGIRVALDTGEWTGVSVDQRSAVRPFAAMLGVDLDATIQHGGIRYLPGFNYLTTSTTISTSTNSTRSTSTAARPLRPWPKLAAWLPVEGSQPTREEL